MFNKLKQFSDLKKQAKDLKSNLSGDEVTGTALDGQVKITMNGNQEIQNVHIDEELLSPDKKEELQDAVKEAFEKAVKEVQMLMIKKVQSGEISMPGME